MPSTREPCSNAAKAQNLLKFAGVPKLANRSQALVGRSLPYYQDMWNRYCCLTSFFPIVDTCLNSEDIAKQSCGWCQNGYLLHPVFSASRLQNISDMHSKFALRPHHVSKYGRHPICGRWWLGEERKKDSATEVFWHSGALQIGLLLLLLLLLNKFFSDYRYMP